MVCEQIVKEVKDKPNSCKISINAKGKFSAEIKVYADSSDEAMNEALKKAKELEILILEKNKEVENGN